MKKIILPLLLLFCVFGTEQTCAQTKAAYLRLMQDECPQAFQQYKQGQQCMIAGWILLGTGLAGASLAFPAWIASSFDSPKPQLPEYKHRNLALFSTGVICSAFVLASVPLLSVGYTRMDKAKKTYNEQCSKQNVDMQLTLNANGVAMVVHF